MGFGAVMPRRLWPGRLQPEGDEAEQFGLRAAGCKRDADTARRLDEPPGELQQTQANAGELALPQRMPGRHAIAEIEQQPVSGGMQNEAHLIGER